MDIDTSSIAASRRNLVILSMGFILFSLGHATLGDGTGKTTITILAGSITFNNPDVLVYFVWIMFGWFLLRFWQFSNHKSDWAIFTSAMFTSPLMKRWYSKNGLVFPTRIDRVYDFNTHHPLFGNWQWPAENGKAFLISKEQILKKLALFIYISATTEHFGQCYFPYCLAIAALTITIHV